MAQNLMPDPGFESYIQQPDYVAGGVTRSLFWFSGNGTPDYFHDQYVSGAKPPDTYRGNQAPASGNGFAGIIAYAENSAFEYLSVELRDILVPDQIYDIRFDINLSNESRSGTDGIGAFVLDHVPHRDSLRRYQYTFRNRYGNILVDTVNWVTIEGQFRAEGGEKYLMIGGKDRNGDLVSFSEPINPDFGFTYYFVDNVYLAPCPNQRITRFELDTTLCEGAQLMIEGLTNAKSYRWNKGGVKRSQVIRSSGTYILDNHYDCEVVQQIFVVDFDECDCNLKLPTLVRNFEYRDIAVSPIVQDWKLSLFDAAGQRLISTNSSFENLSNWVFETSGPYFWLAQLQCWDPNDQLFSRTMSGKIIIQN